VFSIATDERVRIAFTVAGLATSAVTTLSRKRGTAIGGHVLHPTSRYTSAILEAGRGTHPPRFARRPDMVSGRPFGTWLIEVPVHLPTVSLYAGARGYVRIAIVGLYSARRGLIQVGRHNGG
jgi:hypothetical protein